MAAAKTFSSAHLRDRDKILEEKHTKELSILERKIERLKWSNTDTLKQLFEAQTRGKRLAQSLGFNDIYEAQVVVDTADREVPYKECLERVEQLQAGLSFETTKHLTLLDQVKVLEEENELLKIRITALEKAQTNSKVEVAKHRSTSERLAQEVTQLQARYDSLADVKERAVARYKIDYAKWRRFRDWMFTEEEEYAKDRNGISDEDRRKKDFASLMRKKKMMMEIGLDLRQFEGEEGDSVKNASPYPLPPPLGGITNLECDKENQATPVPAQKKPRSTETPFLSSPSPPSSTVVASPNTSMPPLSNATKTIPTPSLRNRLLKSIVNSGLPSSSPSPFLEQSNLTNTRQPLIFHPVVQRSPRIKQEARSTKRQHPDTNGTAVSSDTEDDSQAVSQFLAPMGPSKVPMSPATSPVAMSSSQTEPESQSQIVFPDPTPCPSRPFPKSYPPLPARPALNTISRRNDSNVSYRDVDTLQPLKMRRLNDETLPLPIVDLATPKAPKPKVANEEPPSNSRKGKEKTVQPPSSTPQNATSALGLKPLEDYSAFKGRGRYAKDVIASKDSTNAQYVIDPAKNGGLDFQYDEVVRNKEERKQMDAGDCECCRDYYEAVGPLPSRLKAPLWRSPPTTPLKPCTQHHPHLVASGSRNVQRQQSEIRSHKQAISRHRHRWARAKTPPGYWNIGFPDTQEAEDINEQAREMHKRKQVEIEASAKRDDGKYKMRG